MLRLVRHVLLIGYACCAVVIGWGAVSEAHAQDPAITGQILDAETEEPLAGATVALWKETETDSTMVTGDATSPEGTFTIEPSEAGPFTLRISFVGYESQRVEDVPAQSPPHDVGTIRLAPEPTQVDEVEVTAERPTAEIETDRTTYNTSDRAVSAGGSARTVLGTLPSIQVDIDGSISLRGNESVTLQINGEPASLEGESLVSYLQSIPADAVERVEVIPNPSARYEPEGMAGIINIVLSRDLDAGWNGGFMVAGGRDNNADVGGNASANVGYQRGGFNVLASYSIRRDREEDNDARLLEQFNDSGSNRWTDQAATERERDRSQSLNTQLGYRFSDRTSLDLETSLSLRHDSEDGRTRYAEYLGSTNTSDLQDQYVRLTDVTDTDESIDGRLTFNHEFADDHTLRSQMRYDRDFETEDGVYTTYGIENGTRLDTPRGRELDVVNEDEQDGTLEIDYTRPMGALDLEMETGYKGTLRRLDSDQTFDDNETLFTFDEIIHAGYGILRRGLGDFELETGLRAETVNTDFNLSSEEERTEQSYVSFYPSVFLSYSPNERQQARISYSKRVDRPNLWDINPLDDNEDPTFRNEGNPGLDPEYIHSFELTGTQRWDFGSVTATPYVRHTVNEIEDVTREETTDDGRSVIVRRAENLSSSTSYGAEFVVTFNYGPTEGTLSSNVYRAVTDGSNLTTDRSQDAILFSGRANLRAELRDGLQAEINQFYRPGRDIPPEGRIDAFSSTEVALQQSLFSGNGSLTLRVDDLFNDTNVGIWYRDDDVYQQSNFEWGRREVTLSFQYTFGSGDNDGGPDGGGRRR
ncbi:MAG: TonB-dependent receptor [Longimonas sp.]|uniref:TonB-dependent receptor domain-containing protein n=1 Tax=Longimonas sp. TaxID=2039626 RepID=UPI0039764D3E